MNPIGEIISSQEQKFVVHAGISEPLLNQLVAFSIHGDPDLKAFTQDAKRFESIKKTQAWMQDAVRKIYTLTPGDNHESLAGFGWLREDRDFHYPDTTANTDLLKKYEKVSPNHTRHTVAARIYERYRGQKLAIPFMQLAHQDYMQHVQSEVVIILADIHANNTASQRLFESIGYRFLGPNGQRTLWALDAKK